MKAILEFNLPEEESEHLLALNGGKWMSICNELDQWLRTMHKHGNRDTVKVEEVRSHLHEEMDSAGLSFDS